MILSMYRITAVYSGAKEIKYIKAYDVVAAIVSSGMDLTSISSVEKVHDKDSVSSNGHVS